MSGVGDGGASSTGDSRELLAADEVTSGQAAGRREIVKAALAAGATYRDAGGAGGVSERSVARWMSEPDFAAEVATARSEQVNVVTGRLSTLAAEAVATLHDGLLAERPRDRLQAAALILSWAARSRREGDVETRLIQIEARLGLSGQAHDEGSQ